MTDKIDLKDFFIEQDFYTGFPGLKQGFNYRKILQLSDKDFAEFYLQYMETYKDQDNYWKNGNPTCTHCYNSISTPKDMRKYLGHALHPRCFDEIYLNDDSRTMEPNTRRFFNRLLGFDINQFYKK